MCNNFIIKQKNGLYCVINGEINSILKHNLTKEELITECINDLTCDILGEIASCEDFNKRLEQTLIGSAKVDQNKINIMNKIHDMTAPCNKFKGFKIKVSFANESLKDEFINKINHSSIFTRTSFGDGVMISEKSDKSITITIKEDTGFAPFITCIHDDEIKDNTDNIEQNKYTFVITCSNYKNIYLVYDRIINQFKSLKEFKDDKISVISINGSIIVTFSKLSKYTPVFTII